MGKWMSGLENQKRPVSGATKTTETAKPHDKGVFVVSVAPTQGHFENLEGARQETQAAVVSPKSHRYGATKTTETAKRSPPPDDLWPRLEAIANKCCDHWRDSPERRAEMLADLRAMTPDWQRHWIEHLEASYGKPK